MSMVKPSLPEYAHPPLVAATLGVYFYDGPASLDSAILTDFQHRLGPEWTGQWKECSLEIDYPETDFGIEHSGDQLINVLGDRVLRITPYLISFTWLGTADARYPRYENVRDGFVAAWDIWSELNALTRVHTCSVVYLNRIPQGTVWQTPADWTFFQLRPQSDAISVRVESAHWQLHSPEVGVSWMIDRPSDGSELPSVWVRLQAFNSVNNTSSFLDSMDAGRADIVKTFSDLMSPAANAYWGLRRREK